MTHILFVCTGNTCRSPMAEAYLKSKALPEVEVRSAGVFAMDGSDASVHAQKVLEENNIAQQHQSKLLTQEDVDWATHIITMTSGHKSSVVASFPGAAGKTFTLKEFSGNAFSGDIADPYGGPIESYRATYTQIKDSIEKLVERIRTEK